MLDSSGFVAIRSETLGIILHFWLTTEGSSLMDWALNLQSQVDSVKLSSIVGLLADDRELLTRGVSVRVCVCVCVYREVCGNPISPKHTVWCCQIDIMSFILTPSCCWAFRLFSTVSPKVNIFCINFILVSFSYCGWFPWDFLFCVMDILLGCCLSVIFHIAPSDSL